ncbi:cobalamin-binding protein [bacterium]|nr:MAG: cobalamin-binding protein [bacterium]
MISETLYQTYLKFLLEGQKISCQEIVKKLLESGISVENIYTHLFQRSLYEVGSLWEHNQISVAIEHLATAITEILMNLVYPQLFSQEHTGRSAVISCIANEYHQVGGKMVADIFEMLGWDGFFLGANTPLKDLIKLVESKKPAVVGLSLSIFFGMPQLVKTLDVLRLEFPDIPCMVGGQAFRWGGLESIKNRNQVYYIQTLGDLKTWVLNVS